MKHYDLIFEDASARHLGAALSHGKGALILEPTLHAAKEYIEALFPCPDFPGHGRLSAAVRAQLESLNAIGRGCVHPQGAEHILIRELDESGAEILFLTRIVSVKQAGETIEITALCLDKVETFSCKHFYPAEKAEKHTFNVLAKVNDFTLLPECVKYAPTVYETLAILSIEAEDIGTARRFMSSLKGVTLIHFPSVLCPVQEHYEDLFAALDKGENEGSPEWDGVPRETPHLASLSCDVLVAGAGTAGSVAAISAARSGQSVIAIDRLPFAGGLSTSTVFGYYYGTRGGLYEEIDEYGRRLTETELVAGTGNKNRFNPTAMVIAYDRMFDASGIRFIGDALLTEVRRTGRKVTGVRILTPKGFIDISCGFLLDGTSENHACRLAGCEFHLGRGFDSKTQPFSYVTLHCHEEDGLPCFHTSDFGYTDAADAEIVSENIRRSVKKLQLNKDVVQLGVSCSLGAREGRCIVGENRLKWTDYFSGKPTEKPVTTGLSNMDDHGKDMAFESRMHADWMVGMSMWGTTVRLTVPMGCLIPKDLDNCAIAGRNLDMDHDCASHMRMMRDLRRIGEASGLIAALSVQHGCAAKDVPYDELYAQLLQSGCMENLTEPDVWDTQPDGKLVPYPQTEAEAMAQMTTAKPGLAMLYLLRNGRLDSALESLRSENIWLSFNCACVLALNGNAAGKDILLAALRARDKTLLETSRKFNMTRGITALYLLGRLAAPEAESECRAIWDEDKALLAYAVPSDEFFYRDEDTRFAYLSHATRALVEIGKKYPERKDDILRFLKGKTASPDFSTCYSLKSSKNVVHDGADEIRHLITLLEDDHESL